LVTRLLNHMRDNNYAAAVPRVAHPEKMESTPMLNLNSTYIQHAIELMPKTGNKGQWRPRTNYFTDIREATRGDIVSDMQFYERPMANGNGHLKSV
jgi:hypothetical protein